MEAFLKFLHVAAAIVWLGGMVFLLAALRPAAHALLAPPQRLPLMADVLRRFFPAVWISIAVLLPTGLLRMAAVGAGAPAGWHLMAGIGTVMVLLFAHIWFAPWRRLRAAVAAQDWPAAGKNIGQIALLAKVNMVLGWLAVAAVMLVR